MQQVFRLKRIGMTLVTLMVIVGSLFAQEYRDGMKEGHIRIKFKAELSTLLNSLQTKSVDGILITGIQSLDEVNKQFSTVEMKRVFPYSPKNEAKHKKYGFDLWYELRYTSKISPLEAVAAYAELVEIEIAEPILEATLNKKNSQRRPAP
ncbi:subtilase family N-terminal domain-containing protein [Ancylomarina sp.]|uniref:subtilase family N-terminal domain-containing protein n=1 Tax=Ancylomarina sp. TaxID=1970196 RepID=UPI0035623119